MFHVLSRCRPSFRLARVFVHLSIQRIYSSLYLASSSICLSSVFVHLSIRDWTLKPAAGTRTRLGRYSVTVDGSVYHGRVRRTTERQTSARWRCLHEDHRRKARQERICLHWFPLVGVLSPPAGSSAFVSVSRRKRNAASGHPATCLSRDYYS